MTQLADLHCSGYHSSTSNYNNFSSSVECIQWYTREVGKRRTLTKQMPTRPLTEKHQLFQLKRMRRKAVNTTVSRFTFLLHIWEVHGSTFHPDKLSRQKCFIIFLTTQPPQSLPCCIVTKVRELLLHKTQNWKSSACIQNMSFLQFFQGLPSSCFINTLSYQSF